MSAGDSLDARMERLERDGWFVWPGVVESTLVDTLAAELAESLALRERIRARNGVDGNNDGTLHHLLADHPCYLELLARLEIAAPVFERFFAGKCILNS